MKLYGGIQIGNRNKWLYVGGDPDHHADCQIGNPAITQHMMSDFDETFRLAMQQYKE